MFLVDERNEQIYWTAPLREIENKDLSVQDTYTFHIPKANCLDKNSTVLPEPFIFEIIRYYANFSETIIKQFDKIQNYSTDSDSRANMQELMEVLEKNFDKVDKKYKETINMLIEKIKFDLERSFYYCGQLAHMDEVVRKTVTKTIGECKEKIDVFISRNEVTYKELFELSKEVSELRGFLLGFFREMVYEDMPFGNHDDIEKEFNEWLRETEKFA